jgi:hypothetical protein
MAMTRRDPDERPADADEFLADAREVRVRAHLPVLPVPPPATRTAIPASARPMRGTRLLDLRADAPDPDDADPDLEDDLDDEDSDDLDEPGRRDRRKDSGRVDDLDVAIGHLERRRARTRSRRLLAAWVLLVVLASLAASAAGWSLGAGLLVGS